jgi:hypothetical protein
MRLIAVILFWCVLLVGVFTLPYMMGSPTVGDDVTRWTVWVALLFYAGAASRMLRLGSQDWPGKTPPGRMARWFWTLAWAAFVIHVGAAFHFYHHWSHAAAVEHIRDRSGVGAGIFASYLFTLAWTADVSWWWMRPEGYARRPKCVGRVLQLFMFLMIFFATVVYEDGPVRWVGMALCISICGGLAARWLSCR